MGTCTATAHEALYGNHVHECAYPHHGGALHYCRTCRNLFETPPAPLEQQEAS